MAERVLAPTGSVPAEVFPPSRDWKAGGDLLGTTRAGKARNDVSSEAEEAPEGPCVMLDESKDLLVITDSTCLRRLLARQGATDRKEIQESPAGSRSLTNPAVEDELAGQEPDSEVLSRAADWIDW